MVGSRKVKNSWGAGECMLAGCSQPAIPPLTACFEHAGAKSLEAIGAVASRKYDDAEYFSPECRKSDAINLVTEAYDSKVKNKQHSDRILEIDSSVNILKQASDAICERSITRDNGEDKSMLKTLKVFSELVGHEVMTESEGWLFMACVKLGRSQQGKFHLDDYIDAAAYVALAGEAAAKEQ